MTGTAQQRSFRGFSSCALVVLAAAIGLTLLLISPANIGAAATSGIVAYSSGGRVYLANADGSGVRALTSPADRSSADIFALQVSPDGEQIAYHVAGDEDAILIVERSGGKPRRIAEGSEPAWSPDGKRVAYITSDGDIAAVDPRGGSPQILVSNGSESGGITWAPDGSRLAFVQDAGVLIADLRSHTSRVLAPEGSDPAWSPDGQYIAFTTDDDAIWMIRPDGSALTRVLRPHVNYSTTTPVWSPDSRTLLFDFEPNNGIAQVATVDVTTKEISVLTHSRGDSWGAVWSPDGQRIAYRSGDFPRLGVYDLWIMDRDGKHRVQASRAYPTGIGADNLSWAAVAGRVRPNRLPRTIGLPGARTSAFWSAHRPVAAAGDRVGLVTGREDRLSLWSARSGRVTPTAATCVWGDVVLGDEQIAWICGSDGLGSHPRGLDTLLHGKGTPLHVVPVKEWDVNLGGDRALIVFSHKERLWRLTGRSKRPLRRAPRYVRSVSVDGSRVAMEDINGVVDVMRPDGKSLYRLRVGKFDDARVLADGSVVVTSTRTIRVFGRAGRLLREIRNGPNTRLLAAKGRLIVFATGLVVHVFDVVSGRSFALGRKDEGVDVAAVLDPSGLFYAYSLPYATKPYRVAYLPISRLQAALERP